MSEFISALNLSFNTIEKLLYNELPLIANRFSQRETTSITPTENIATLVSPQETSNTPLSNKNIATINKLY